MQRCSKMYVLGVVESWLESGLFWLALVIYPVLLQSWLEGAHRGMIVVVRFAKAPTELCFTNWHRKVSKVAYEEHGGLALSSMVILNFKSHDTQEGNVTTRWEIDLYP